MAESSSFILDVLSKLKDKDLPDMFSKHAESIFILNHDEITAVLDQKTTKNLNNIRKALLVRFSELCHKYTPESVRYRAIETHNRLDFVQDILLLGNSIVNKGPVENIELVYEVDNSLDLDNPSAMKEIVKQLLQCTKVLKDEVLQLKNENVNLSNELALLKTRLDLDEPDEIEIDGSETDKPDLHELDELPVSENKTEPPKIKARPVKGVIKTANVFIGSVQSPCTKFDIQTNIQLNTSVNPKISDIHELKVRGNSLAFRVTVPKDKLHEVISESVWESHITAEIYDPQRPQKYHVPKGINSNKGSNRKPPFRNSRPTTHRSHRSQKAHRSSYHANAWGSPSSERYYRDQYYRDQFRPQYEY